MARAPGPSSKSARLPVPGHRHAAQVLAGLAVAGVHESCHGGLVGLRICLSRALLRLAQVLSGADHFRRMRLNPAVMEPAVTMPLALVESGSRTEAPGVPARVGPTVTATAALINPTNPSNAEILSRDLQATARLLALQLHLLHASSDADIVRNFD